jgi:squamous cell carcinoma antigen recognized by T-cells 3
VQLIGLLTDLKLVQKLELARREFAERFPLSEQLWLAWIADTLEAITDDESQAFKLLSLVQRAVQDYASVDLWQQYLEYGVAAYDFDSMSLTLAWRSYRHT